jgi:hypothetical protein
MLSSFLYTSRNLGTLSPTIMHISLCRMHYNTTDEQLNVVLYNANFRVCELPVTLFQQPVWLCVRLDDGPSFFVSDPRLLRDFLQQELSQEHNYYIVAEQTVLFITWAVNIFFFFIHCALIFKVLLIILLDWFMYSLCCWCFPHAVPVYALWTMVCPISRSRATY